jgi:asparagine synthase (glutamine-hydrolysing)
VCAIFGVIGGHDDESTKASFVSLAHRGEDGSEYISNENYFFGIHRLAITSACENKTQIFEKSGYIVLLNGEIYNHKELDEQIGNISLSEEETIYEYYKKYGDEFVNHINGMYAIAINDGKKLKLFRDKVGKKPLFYRIIDGSFWFASEIKALGSNHKIRYEGLPSYLSFQTTISPNTFFEDIYSLDAGSSLEFDGENIKIASCYKPLKNKINYSTSMESKIAVHAVLKEAVSCRVPDGVDFGVLLSGGIDSSLIAGILSKEHKIDTYCVGYENKYAKYDERKYAQIVSKKIDTSHTEVIFTKELFYENMKIVDSYFEAPLGDPAILPLLSVLRKIKGDGKKVVITGDGSDELFLGYKTYKEFYDIEKLKEFKRPNWLLNQLKSNYSPNKEWEWHKRALEGSLLFRSTAELFTDLQQNRILRRNIKDNTSQSVIQNYRDEFINSGRTSELDWYSFCDMRIKLGELFLTKLDRASMICGLEARSPFLDESVVECAFNISPEIKFGNRSKAIIKDIASEYLPSEIIERKKRGFSYPYMEWLVEENELELIRKVNSEYKIFVDDEVDFLLSKANSGGFKHQIFALYMYCRWLSKR